MDYLSQAYYVEGDIMAAIDLNKEAVNIFEEKNIEKNYLYPELLYNLWNLYEALNNPKEAHAFAEKSIEYYRVLDCKDDNYTKLLFGYSECVSTENRYKYAIELASEALCLLENISSVPDSVLVMYRCQLANHYSNNGDMDSAYYYAQEALCDIESKFSLPSINYINTKPKLAKILWFSGEQEKSLSQYKEALAYTERYYPDSEIHFRILNDFAYCCNFSGHYTDAVDIQRRAVQLAKMLYGTESENYAESINKFFMYSTIISDMAELKEIISDGRMDSLNYSRINVQNIRQQAILAFHQGNIPKAESIITDACQVMSNDSTMSMDYASLLMLKAELYNFTGKSMYALASLEKAYTIFTSHFGEEKPDKYYYNYWNTLGIANANLKRYDKAEEAFSKSISATKLLYGEKHLEHLIPQVVLAVIRSINGNTEGAALMMSTLFNNLREHIFQQFATMSSNERSAYWSKVSVVFNTCMPFLAYNSQNEKYYGDGYNALLLSKGLLLNTNQEIAQLLINSKDENGLKLYNELLRVQQKLNSLPVSANSRTSADADSLREVIRQGERDLMTISSTYGDYTRNLRFSWQDVKHSLKKDEVAIEFVDFYDFDGNNIYAAFVLKNDMENPQVVRLFDYADYSNLNSHRYYKTDSLYNLIWKPLEPYFSKDSKIYFSPQGIRHSIALESLVSSNGICISERFPTYRLSSTKELCITDFSEKNKSAYFMEG